MTILRARQSIVTSNQVPKPDVTMKARYVVQIACNDKVFDASENVFSTKLLVEGKEKKTIILYNDVYVPRKKSQPLPKIRVMVLPPYVSRCRKI